MRINIVNYEQGRYDGILSKYARKMAEILGQHGHDVTVQATPDKKAKINHHINYESFIPTPGTINTLMVTHITTPEKLANIKDGMKVADWGICFSEDTQKYLEKEGIGKLSTVIPAHDELPRRPKIISILTNVYPNGCKREGMLVELLKHIDNSKFVFLIMGKDWERTLDPLIKKDGFQGQLHPNFDAENYKRILDISDFCLYFGKDEGSMGILDAANNGVITIAPEEGFHKDIGIDLPFDTQEELNQIFDNLAFNPVEGWTWEEYVKKHETLWGDLLKKKSTKK